MKWESLSEAQIAWAVWNLQEQLNNLLWDRYEEEFLQWAMDENDRRQMEKMLQEESDGLLDPEF
jgi:hypothetical protein